MGFVASAATSSDCTCAQQHAYKHGQSYRFPVFRECWQPTFLPEEQALSTRYAYWSFCGLAWCILRSLV